jgi:hypothetical protein
VFLPLEQALLANALTASQTGAELDRMLAFVINTANTTVYDKAIDGAYLTTHVGGSHLHHLLDGQHDLVGAFEAARHAYPNDAFAQELLGTAHHLTKDAFSVMGLPLVSLEPDTYADASSWIQQHIGIPKSWHADLLQINATELLGGALASAAVVVGIKRKDVGMLAELAGGVGLGSVLAANPIAILAAATALVAALRLRQEGMPPCVLARKAAAGAASVGSVMLAGKLLAGFAATGTLPLVLSLTLSLGAGLLMRRMLHLRAGAVPDTASSAIVVPDHEIWTSQVASVSRQLSGVYDARTLAVLHNALSANVSAEWLLSMETVR